MDEKATKDLITLLADISDGLAALAQTKICRRDLCTDYEAAQERRDRAEEIRRLWS